MVVVEYVSAQSIHLLARNNTSLHPQRVLRDLTPSFITNPSISITLEKGVYPPLPKLLISVTYLFTLDGRLRERDLQQSVNFAGESSRKMFFSEQSKSSISQFPLNCAYETVLVNRKSGVATVW